MPNIHLIRSAQVTPFLRVLEDVGAAVEDLAEQVGMPIDAVRGGWGVIGEFCAWRFIDLAAKQQRWNLFGYEVACRYPLHSVEGLGGYRVRHSESLQQLLENFIAEVQDESTGCHYSLQDDPAGLWFDRQLMFGEHRRNWQTEQYMIAIFVQIIRFCAGPRWLPAQVMVSSDSRALPLPAEWRGIEFEWGGDSTRILIPRETLALPLIEPPALDDQPGGDTETGTPLAFSELVRTQILVNHVGLENAAEQTGLSPSTLKRRLAAENLSYSKLLDDLRLEMARSELREATRSLQEIARLLGYEHQSNFTRAFKKAQGETPRQYRARFRP